MKEDKQLKILSIIIIITLTLSMVITELYFNHLDNVAAEKLETNNYKY